MSKQHKYLGKTFNDIKNIFTNKGCRLVTTQDEFNKINLVSNSKFKFIPKCCMRIYCFEKQPRSVMCNNCQKVLIKKISNEMKNVLDTKHVEHDSYKYFTDLVSKKFDFIKTKEGCVFDIMIKPINVQTDEYLQVQLKSTIKKGVNGCYSFDFTGQDYSNGIMCLISNQENKIWLLDGLLANIKKISIGEKSTKYSKYEVYDDTIDNKLLEFYNKKEKYTKDKCLTPVSIYQQREQKYMKLREDKMKYFDIKYPEIEGQLHNLIINGYKIQDKVIGKRCARKNSYYINLYHNNGKKCFKCYNKGDNDFYWFWRDDSTLFYVIKEQDLIDLKYIQDNGNLGDKRKTISFSLYTDSPVKNLLDKCTYDINDPKLEEKIKKLFN